MKKIHLFISLLFLAMFWWGCPPTPPKPNPQPVDKWPVRYVDEFDRLLDLVKPSNSPTSSITYAYGKLFMESLGEKTSASMIAENIAIGDSFQAWLDIEQASNDFYLAFERLTSSTKFYIYRDSDFKPYELWLDQNGQQQKLTFAGVKDTCSLGLFFNRDLVQFYYATKKDTLQVYQMPRPNFPLFNIVINAYFTPKNGTAILERLTFLSTDSLFFGAPPDTVTPPPALTKRDTVTVSWSPPPDADLWGYEFDVDSGNGFVGGIQMEKFKQSVTMMLIVGRDYGFRVRSVDSSDNRSIPAEKFYRLLDEGEKLSVRGKPHGRIYLGDSTIVVDQ